MKYETAAEMAERLKVNIRTIQMWAKSRKLPGAQKIGRDWVIPYVPEEPIEEPVAEPVKAFSTIMPLINSSFEPGKCIEYIENIKDEDFRNIAWAEYYYFSAQPEKAAAYSEKYVDSDDPALRLSAYLIYSFANLSLGRVAITQEKLHLIQKGLQIGMQADVEPHFKAICVFIATTASTLLHLPIAMDISLSSYIHLLPVGLRIFACYILAHQAYIDGDYKRSLGIIETALAFQSEPYPIAMIYSHLVAVMDLMCLDEKERAREHFMQAWELARPDGLLEGIGEHHGLTYGMIENCLKKDFPEEYERIIEITYRFSKGWRRIHNPQTNENVADNLTTTEFSIAMLAKRGWSNKEIADHMGFSVHTVKQYMSIVFQKLDITSRKQLSEYMLR